MVPRRAALFSEHQPQPLALPERGAEVDEIKVDRSFVSEMLDNPDDELIVGAIIGLSHNFGRRIVAEGIETREVQDRLIAMGCEVGQGFYYTRPIPRQQALEWAANFSPES